MTGQPRGTRNAPCLPIYMPPVRGSSLCLQAACSEWTRAHRHPGPLVNPGRYLGHGPWWSRLAGTMQHLPSRPFLCLSRGHVLCC